MYAFAWAVTKMSSLRSYCTNPHIVIISIGPAWSMMKEDNHPLWHSGIILGSYHPVLTYRSLFYIGNLNVPIKITDSVITIKICVRVIIIIFILYKAYGLNTSFQN
jgi:hypothetical protein